MINQTEIAMNKKAENQDDLQKIKGIGKSVAQALNELGIHRFSELASYTEEQLLEMLKDKVPPIALQRSRLQAWIEQAHVLAEGKENTNSPINSLKSPISKEESAEGENQEILSRPGWREIADFFVSFGYEVDNKGDERLSTRVHYSQADQSMQWDGIVLDELLQWLQEHAKLPEVTESPDSLLESKAEAIALPEEEESVSIDLSNLWVSEVVVPIPGQDVGGTAHLMVSSELNLSGPASEDYTRERHEFAVDILLVDTKKNQSILSGTYSGNLTPDILSYPILQEFPVPSIGRYQLYLIARMSPLAENVTMLQGPIILVEA